MNPLDPLKLRDDKPLWPHLLQLLRVTAATVPGPSGFEQFPGSSVPGPTLYVSFTQQMRDDGSLLPRDREPCLVDDVTGKGLSPGWHLGRLAGSWTGLPVYEVVPESGVAGPPGPAGSNFLIYVNDVLFPTEPGLDLKQAADGHITITGADVGGSYTKVTFDCLPDGGTYIFNSDTMTWNSSTIIVNTSVVTFNSSSTVTFNTPIILNSYIAQVPYRWVGSSSSPPDDFINPYGNQFFIIPPLSTGATINAIPAPTMAGAIDGAFLEIYNNSGFTIQFKNNSSVGGGSVAANRILTPNGCTWFLLTGETLFLKYAIDAFGIGAGGWIILWEPPHYQVNDGPTPPYYYQCIDLVAGCGITINTNTDCANNRLKVTIQGAGLTTTRTRVTGVTFDPVACSITVTSTTDTFTCGILTG